MPSTPTSPTKAGELPHDLHSLLCQRNGNNHWAHNLKSSEESETIVNTKKYISSGTLPVHHHILEKGMKEQCLCKTGKLGGNQQIDLKRWALWSAFTANLQASWMKVCFLEIYIEFLSPQ